MKHLSLTFYFLKVQQDGAADESRGEEQSKVTEYYVLDDLSGEIIRANKDMIREIIDNLNLVIIIFEFKRNFIIITQRFEFSYP